MLALSPPPTTAPLRAPQRSSSCCSCLRSARRSPSAPGPAQIRATTGAPPCSPRPTPPPPASVASPAASGTGPHPRTRSRRRSTSSAQVRRGVAARTRFGHTPCGSARARSQPLLAQHLCPPCPRADAWRGQFAQSVFFLGYLIGSGVFGSVSCAMRAHASSCKPMPAHASPCMPMHAHRVAPPMHAAASHPPIPPCACSVSHTHHSRPHPLKLLAPGPHAQLADALGRRACLFIASATTAAFAAAGAACTSYWPWLVMRAGAGAGAAGASLG